MDDIVFLETGEEVPADSQVLSAVNLHVDQSKFTGEPEPVPKMPKQNGEIPESMRNATYPYDQLLRGSTVLEGYGYVRITAVGGNTEMGRTASAATDITSIETPLQKQLNRLGKLIAIVGTTLSLTLLAILIAPGAFQRFASGILVRICAVGEHSYASGAVHDRRHADCRGCAGRSRHERHAESRLQYAPDDRKQLPCPQTACL